MIKFLVNQLNVYKVRKMYIGQANRCHNWTYFPTFMTIFISLQAHFLFEWLSFQIPTARL